MRFDTPVYFQSAEKGDYNAKKGDYSPDTVKEEKRYASVTNAGVETLRLVYGELKQGCLTIRLQAPYSLPFDTIRVGAKVYRVDMSRTLRRKQVFIVSEVQ